MPFVPASVQERAKNALQLALNLGSQSMGSASDLNQLAALEVWEEDIRKEPGRAGAKTTTCSGRLFASHQAES